MSAQHYPSATVIGSSSAEMRELSEGEVDLVFTGPPYFSDATEIELRRPLREQKHYERVLREITEFAYTLRPVFKEVGRVLKPSGVLVLQTKHIRYGRWLLPLADLHTEMSLDAGLRMLFKLEWLSTGLNPDRQPAFVRRPRRGNLKTFDTESFYVFCKEDPPEKGESLSGVELEGSPEELAMPLWRTDVARGRRHPFACPPVVVRRFIQCFTQPGDLVVDPFSGHGTTLVEAQKLGRRAVGYEIVPENVAEIKRRLQ